jgi:hypothetical protein
MSIISINGKISSGKDTVGKIIQYLTSECGDSNSSRHRTYAEFLKRGGGSNLRNFDQHYVSDWEVKKFAGKLKQTASLLTGIPVEKFEDQEFKKQEMPECWNKLYWNDPDPIEGNDYLITQRIQYEDDTSLIIYGDGSEAEVFDNEIVSKPMTYREFLQKLGTEAMRDGLHTNVWVNALFADYKPFVKEWDELGNDTLVEYPNWILTDMRFPNEMEAVELREGVTIKVVRPGTAVGTHPSETALDDAYFDHVISNDGTIEDLIEEVRQVLTIERII